MIDICAAAIAFESAGRGTPKGRLGLRAGTAIAFIVVMGVTPEVFGFFILSTPAGYIIGNYISSRLAQRVSRAQMISIGSLLAMIGTGATVALALMDLDTPYTLIVPMFIYSWGSGFLVPNSLAGALTAVEPAAAGSAAALGGFIQMSAGFLSTLAVASLVQTPLRRRSPFR